MRRRLLRAGALAALAIAAAGAPGCERESNVGHQDSRVSVEQEQSSIPVPTGVLSIEVFEGVDGEASSIRIDDGATVDRLTAGLREGAKPSYIDDPEPSGQLYRVDMRGVDAAGTPYTFTFTLNDMTGTDALQDAVKLYLAREDGATAAWTVPSGWALELLGRAAYGERRLRIAAIPHSGSVAVQANRRIRTASAPAAIEETLQFAGLEPDEQAPEYKIHWSDPQRFVVRFEPLPDGTAVRFRLDGLATAEGETFANEAEPRLTAATLTSASAWGGLSQADADGTVERSGRLGEAVLIGPLTGDGTDAVLAYGADGMNTLFDLGTGTTRTLPAISWPDEASPPFGNDYGADVLFADRMNGDSVYAVHGNRTLYRVRLDTGEATKLYASETPVKALATAPDGRRVALLVNLPESLTAEGDVLVLDDAGKPMTVARGATSGAHSDGFLFPIPMRWVDDRTIAVRRYDGESGVASVDASSGAIRADAGPQLPEEAKRLLDEAVGWPAETFRVLPEPEGGGRYAVQTEEGAWLVDPAASRASWLGLGAALRWTADGRVAVWTQPPSAARGPYLLGLP